MRLLRLIDHAFRLLHSLLVTHELLVQVVTVLLAQIWIVS